VLVTEPTFPGCGIYVRPIGVFHMEDEKGPDEKIICVPLKDPRWSQAQTVDDIGSAFMDELEHFFQVYKSLEAGKVETGGFAGVDEALRFIREARERAAA
jgi:inorganic pyrophosphatase